MIKKAKKPTGLKAINDIYIIKEDPLETQVDSASGLTVAVVNAIKTSKLHLPDQGKYFIDKFPFKGTVLSKGDKTKYDEIQVGSKVMYGRLGGQRWVENDVQYMSIREKDLHALL